jgi:hypothetical protein
VDTYYREVKDDRDVNRDGDMYNENNYFIRSTYFGVFPTGTSLSTTMWKVEVYDDTKDEMIELGM